MTFSLTLRRFYNCVWLVLNDIIIGVAFGSFLCENCHVLGSLLDSLTQAGHRPRKLCLRNDLWHSTIWWRTCNAHSSGLTAGQPG